MVPPLLVYLNVVRDGAFARFGTFVSRRVGGSVPERDPTRNSVVADAVRSRIARRCNACCRALDRPRTENVIGQLVTRS
jgi:hypothetical protein